MNGRGWFSQFSPRFVWALVALVALNLAVSQKHGYYSRTAALEVSLALVAALLACRCRIDAAPIQEADRGQAGGTSSGTRRSLALVPMIAAALVLSGKALLVTNSMKNGPIAGLVTLRVAAGMGFVLICLFAVLDHGRPQTQTTSFRLRLVLLFAAGTVLRAAPVVIWPEPPIDVYAWLREAPRVLLEGNNPYVPENMSTGALAVYPPLPIVLTAPFSAVGLDVRYANVLCDLLAAWLLLELARRRGRPLLVGALIAGTYLNLPGVPFMLKNAWFEPMLAVLLGGGIALVERGHRLGNVLLGLGITGKQFGLPLLLPLWRALHGGRKGLLVGVGLASAAVLVPFLLWSPGHFLNSILHLHLALGPDLNSLTLRSAAHHLLKWSIPGWLAAGLALCLTAWVSWRTPATRGAAGLLLGTTLLIFCLFFPKGYFNYYYLCSYLFLLGLTALAPDRTPAACREPVRIAA